MIIRLNKLPMRFISRVTNSRFFGKIVESVDWEVDNDKYKIEFKISKYTPFKFWCNGVVKTVHMRWKLGLFDRIRLFYYWILSKRQKNVK